MKIIFLDIDGVLNNSHSSTIGTEFGDNPQPALIKQLNRICDRTGAKVVISSTWRKLAFWTQIWRLLDVLGFTGEIVGQTPIINKIGTRRGHEIQAWIDELGEPLESFVILDDDSDMEHLMGHLVQTDGSVGLTGADAQRAVEILNKKI